MATFEGKVETPATPQPPNNYIAQQAMQASDVEEIDKLIEHAQQHGYDQEGQTMKFLRSRRGQVAAGLKPTALGGRK